MLVKDILEEMKHNGLLKLITHVPTDLRDSLTIGGIVMEEEIPKPILSWGADGARGLYYIDEALSKEPIEHRHEEAIYDILKGYDGVWTRYNRPRYEYVGDELSYIHTKENEDSYIAAGGDRWGWYKDKHDYSMKHDKTYQLYNEELENKLPVKWQWKQIYGKDKVIEFCKENELDINKVQIEHYYSGYGKENEEAYYLKTLVAVPQINIADVVIPFDIQMPYSGLTIHWGMKGKRKKIDVLIDICKDMGIKSFTQLIFGSTSVNQNRITWNYPTNPFW